MRSGHRRNVLHHTLAALGGFVVAALMVFLVFDSASEQGAAQDGSAGPVGVEEADSSCGSISVADTDSAEAVAIALDELPIINDASGQPVTITDDGQRAWFARVHAGLSVCGDEMSLRPNSNPAQLVVSATVPAEWSKGRASQHAHAALRAAFEDSPFNLKRVKLTMRHGGATRTVNVTSPVWATYRNNAEAFGLKPTVAGLQKLNRRVGYKTGELEITGW